MEGPLLLTPHPLYILAPLETMQLGQDYGQQLGTGGRELMPSQMALMTLPIPFCEEMLTATTLGGSSADIHSFSDFMMAAVTSAKEDRIPQHPR